MWSLQGQGGSPGVSRSLEISAPWGGVCLIQSSNTRLLKRPQVQAPDDSPEMGEKNGLLCRPHSIHLGGKQ